jgi:hypothetical protein
MTFYGVTASKNEDPPAIVTGDIVFTVGSDSGYVGYRIGSLGVLVSGDFLGNALFEMYQTNPFGALYLFTLVIVADDDPGADLFESIDIHGENFVAADAFSNWGGGQRSWEWTCPANFLVDKIGLNVGVDITP